MPEMLNHIHKYMLHIDLLTSQISGLTSSAIQILTLEEDYDNAFQSLSDTFRSLKSIMDQALKHSSEIEKRINAFSSMASELIECCVASTSLSWHEKATSKAAFNEYRARINRLDQEKQELIENIEHYQRFVWQPYMNIRAFDCF